MELALWCLDGWAFLRMVARWVAMGDGMETRTFLRAPLAQVSARSSVQSHPLFSFLCNMA